MIERIVNANYFNPLLSIRMPWCEKSNAHTLRWVVSGSASFTAGDKEAVLCSNQIMLTPASEEITMISHNEQKLVFAVASFEGDLSTFKHIPANTPITLSPVGHELLFQFFYTASQHNTDTTQPSNDILAERYLTSLLQTFLLRLDLLNSESKGLVFSAPYKSQTHLNDQKITFAIKEYLLAHLKGTVTLDEIARAVGVSTNTAMHVFKKDVGMGIMSYFTKLKIDAAMGLISEGELSIRTISEQLGFDSPEYFSRVFKKQTGISPTEYSKQQSKWSGCLASLFM